MKHTDTFGPLSFSSLNAFAQSPRAFVHYKTAERVQTPAMRMGTMAHRHILEPALFNSSTVVYEGHRRGNAWKEFQQEHEGKDILTAAEMDQLHGMKQAIKDHPGALRLLQQCEVREMPVDFTKWGIKHRGIVDAFGAGFLMDLKITNDVSERALSRVIWERRYYMQAAIYAHAMTYHGYTVDECYIIAVQSAAPYHVTVCELLPHYIVRGHDEWCRLLELFQDWDGEPHHAHGESATIEVDAPMWAPLPEAMTGDKRKG